MSSDDAATPTNEKILQGFLQEHPWVKYIKLQWVDYSGVLHALHIPKGRCMEMASKAEDVSIDYSVVLAPISTTPSTFPSDERHKTWFLRPDWSSLRVCCSKPDHAVVMAFTNEQTFTWIKSGCPRLLLSNTVGKLSKSIGDIQVGFKIEFVLLDESNNVIKSTGRLDGYCETAGLLTETLDLVEEIVEALDRSTIGIDHFHAKSDEQLEIALTYKPALEAVDSLVLAQETIRSMCLRRGVKASMAPKPVLSGISNGLNLRLKIGKLSQSTPDKFLAGILEQMTSLCALGMANYDGCSRYASESMKEWFECDMDNRDSPLRNIGPREWEIRTMDSTANPYLFTACVLLVGFDRLESKTKTSPKSSSGNGGYKRSALDHGARKPVPTSFKEALSDLRNNEALKALIGEKLMAWYIFVKDVDMKEFAKMTNEQRRLRFLQFF